MSFPFFTMVIIHLQATRPEKNADKNPITKTH